MSSTIRLTGTSELIRSTSFCYKFDKRNCSVRRSNQAARLRNILRLAPPFEKLLRR